MAILTVDDFAAWDVAEPEKLPELVEDVLATAAIVAPCLTDPAFPYGRAARATLREAVLRRLDAGTGAVVTRSEGTGPFSRSETIDNRTRRAILSPSDIGDLQALCRAFNGATRPRAGAVNLDPTPTPTGPPVHPFRLA